MVKFRCSKCNQKMGVPDEWVGRRVKCTRCQTPNVVPGEEPSPVEAALAFPDRGGDELQLQNDPDEAFSANVWDGFDPNAVNSAAPAIEPVDPLNGVAVAHAWQRQTAPAPSAAAGALKTAGKGPLCLVMSVLFAVVAAALYAGVVAGTEYHLFILEIGIGWAAGLGLVLFTENRGVLLGLLAVGIAMFGLLVGKVFIAKWYVAPELKRILAEEKASGEWDFQITDEDAAELAEDRDYVSIVAVLHLEAEGKIGADFVDRVIRTFGNLGWDAVSQEELDSVIAMVDETVEGWDPPTRVAKIRQYGPQLGERIINTGIDTGVGTALLLVGAFGLWDLFCIPLALVAAFKMGNGTND